MSLFALSALTLPIVAATALILDRLLAEPRHHPLVWFGNYANLVESKLNHGDCIWRGVVALLLVATPPLALLYWLSFLLTNQPLATLLLDSAVLYFVIGWQSLKQHADAVYQPLLVNNIATARQRLAMIVSRETHTMAAPQIVGSTVESLLENGNDCLFASLFWYAVLGPVGALLHRLINTLDAMWGYKNQRYLRFGKCAATADDVLAWLPARLTAITYALSGNTICALQSWRTQAKHHTSPNGGAVMAAGAGALQCKIGGPQIYQRQRVEKPWLGCGETATKQHIVDCYGLIERGVAIWLVAFVGIGIFKLLAVNYLLSTT